MENVVGKSIGNYVDEALTLFGEDVNTNRQLPLVYDGLKPSYRRLINTALQQGDQLKKVAAIVGQTIATTHPHGEASLLKPVSNMVRWGIFEGQGNHGAKLLLGDNIDPSAPRYIEAKIAPQYRKFFSELLPYVPYVEAEMEGNVEPVYLPTPYPICLTHGSMGIGLGVNTRIPAFTMKSIHQAYIHNDPTLLEAPFGLELDKANSELFELWTKGIGKLTYKFKVEYASTPSGYGVKFMGSPELCKPTFSNIAPQIKWGRLYTVDMSNEEGDVIFIGRNFNIKGISYEQIYEYAQKDAIYTKTFRLTVADNKAVNDVGAKYNQAYLIPMKDWLDITYKNYIRLINVFKQDRIDKLEFDYRVYYWLPKVAEVLLNNRDFDTNNIVANIGNADCDIDVVRAILKKSINTLRNTDSTNKLNSIKAQIQHYKDIDPAKRVDEIIAEF